MRLGGVDGTNPGEGEMKHVGGWVLAALAGWNCAVLIHVIEVLAL
ncbi:MAG TPA: hypothetical protein VGU26_10215 [Gaiellaceae bacterium]|nr:hypothetical protein [Gaiellaceae bacterium]